MVEKSMLRRVMGLWVLICVGSVMAPGLEASGQELPLVEGAAIQPLLVKVGRLREALAYLGEPLPNNVLREIEAAELMEDGEAASLRIQAALDPLCVAGVMISPESRVKVAPGPAERDLVQQGWRQFLVKVQNGAGVTAPLRAASPQAIRLHNSPAKEVRDRWLDMQMFDGRPLNARLSGAKLEYRVIQLYSRDAGKRSAVVSFNVGQGSQDIGFRNDVTLTFDCAAATEVTLRVLDENGEPTMAGFEVRDSAKRVYPSQAKRLAPDFFFHPQVYRGDGEKLNLPAGTYTVDYYRGPESIRQQREVVVGDKPLELTFQMERWIDPSLDGWWSGDHHIHASGCAHYMQPTVGVRPEDMVRQILGEDVKIGATLTWGPGFDGQKGFFTGTEDKVSQYPYLLRYDIEVSGFGSHRSGHLCLLQLTEQIYPGGDSSAHWPTLCLNTLKWAKAQGGVTGPAHSGWGLAVDTAQLPNYIIPPFDSIGAMEYIVDVTHEVPTPNGMERAVDFISMCDTPSVWELNIWYHTLNVGYRTRISGETDFPCIYGERVGLGRSYVKLDGRLDYNAWVQGVKAGRAYVSDGRSHLMDFTAGGLGVGEQGSELRLKKAGRVEVTARVAGRLPMEPETLEHLPLSGDTRKHPEVGDQPYNSKPYWHLERARIRDTRTAPVELLVNGYPVARRVIPMDGKIRDVTFDVEIKESSWVALRILPSSHTNPVFVIVDDKPIRASKRSAQWCRDGVDQLWGQKKPFIAAEEMADAEAAYEHARRAYDRIIMESK